MWKRLTKRVDKIEQALSSVGGINIDEAVEFFGSLDIVQLHIFIGWCKQAELEGPGDLGVLRRHLSAYDETCVIFDYETGEYRQPTEREKSQSCCVKDKTVTADQVIEWLVEQHGRNACAFHKCRPPWPEQTHLPSSNSHTSDSSSTILRSNLASWTIDSEWDGVFVRDS